MAAMPKTAPTHRPREFEEVPDDMAVAAAAMLAVEIATATALTAVADPL